MTADQIDELKKAVLNKKLIINELLSIIINEKFALEHALRNAYSNMIRLKGKQVVPPNTINTKSSNPKNLRSAHLSQTQRLLISQKSK